jgi:hypothetical protein
MKSKNKKSIKLAIFFGALVIMIAVGMLYFNRAESENQITNSPKSSSGIIASVNNEKINYEEVLQIKDTLTQEGQNVSDKEIIEFLIEQKLILKETNKDKYLVSKEDAEEYIKIQLAMMEMSIEDYEKELKKINSSFDKQIELMQKNIAIQNYFSDAIDEESINVTEEEAKEFYQMYKSYSSDDFPEFEEIEFEIYQALEQQKQQQAIKLLINELRKEADIKYY